MVPGIGILILLAVTPPPAKADIDAARSVIAVVTHKGGFAAGRAHDHLVVASTFEATLALDPARALQAQFDLSFPTERLEVDRPTDQAAWSPRLVALGVLDEPLRELTEKQRADVRASMLGRKQLDAIAFPRITARVVRIGEREEMRGGERFPYEVTLALTVHGKTAERPVAARLVSAGGRSVIEALGTFRFTDFGIQPFSAFLGAVKNQDDFHVYLHLEAIQPPRPAG